MTSDRPRMTRRVAAVLMALGIAVAGGVGSFLTIDWYLLQRQTAPGPSPTGDGPTFDEALATASSELANVSNGPWALFSAYGIAAQLPFSPNLIGYPSGENKTVNSCERAFNGLSLWNGTIPTFHGSFNSGTAPFWQLAFFSNTSQQVLLATVVGGFAHLFTPINISDDCSPWYDFGPGNTSQWVALQKYLPVDSSVAASIAWSAVVVAPTTVAKQIGLEGPTVEIMTTGPGVFMGLGDQPGSTWGVYFDRCGEAGITGVQPLVVAEVSRNGQSASASVLGHNCALQFSGAGAFDSEYDLIFSTPSKTSNASVTVVSVPFQVGIAYTNGTFAGDFDEVGLANWMTELGLADSAGQTLAPANPGCAGWVPSLELCPPSSHGWYAVLLSPFGSWEDSYGSAQNKTGAVGWSISVDALVSNQEFAFVFPSSWNVTGDVLNVSCSDTFSVIEGSTVL